MKKMLFSFTALALISNFFVIIKTNNYQNTNKDNNIYLSLKTGPATWNINYSKYCQIWANWSSTAVFNDTKPYLLFDYKNYASDWNSFEELYPNISVNTNGEAISTATFGDVGKGKFGLLHFDSETFNNANEKIRYLYMVNSHDSKNFGYAIDTQIGLGFQMQGTKLYLVTTIYGSLQSIGAYTRYLDFGLSVGDVTFNRARN